MPNEEVRGARLTEKGQADICTHVPLELNSIVHGLKASESSERALMEVVTFKLRETKLALSTAPLHLSSMHICPRGMLHLIDIAKVMLLF